MDSGKLIPVLLVVNELNGDNDIVLRPTGTEMLEDVTPGSWILVLTRVKGIRRVGGYTVGDGPGSLCPDSPLGDDDRIRPRIDVSPAMEETYVLDFSAGAIEKILAPHTVVGVVPGFDASPGSAETK